MSDSQVQYWKGDAIELEAHDSSGKLIQNQITALSRVSVLPRNFINYTVLSLLYSLYSKNAAYPWFNIIQYNLYCILL